MFLKRSVNGWSWYFTRYQCDQWPWCERSSVCGTKDARGFPLQNVKKWNPRRRPEGHADLADFFHELAVCSTFAALITASTFTACRHRVPPEAGASRRRPAGIVWYNSFSILYLSCYTAVWCNKVSISVQRNTDLVKWNLNQFLFLNRRYSLFELLQFELMDEKLM